MFLFNAVVFGFFIVLIALMALDLVPGPTITINTWSVAQPTIPRRWLVLAFWTNLVLAIAAGGLFIGTTGQVLLVVWSDVAQSFIWLAMATDAVIAKKRLWIVVTVIFLAFSIYQVTTHF